MDLNRYFKPRTDKNIASTPSTSKTVVQAQNVDTESLNSDEDMECDIGTRNIREMSSEVQKQKSVKMRSRRKKPKREFKTEWATENPELSLWLENKDNKAYCKICKKTIEGGFTHVKRHSGSVGHKNKISSAKSCHKVSDFIHSSKEKETMDRVKEAEIKMVMFLAEHNLPFLLLDHLPQFISSVCPDSEIAKRLKCGRKKGTNICSQLLATENINNVVSDLQENKYSLIVDETTDISSKKSLAMVVRYYKKIKVVDKFLGLIEVETGTGEGLFNTIYSFFEKNNIPMGNMIGFAADNASVMQGNIKGLASRFKNVSPDIFILGCVCHSVHLCSSAACKKLPKSVEQLARDVVSYFAHSSKRIGQLKECQIFADLKPHKLLKPSQTRWLSLQAVVDRIIEQWSALILYFTNETFDEPTSLNPSNILKALKNDLFKLYFSFLSYVLGIINKVNVEFQSESPKIHVLSTRISSLYKTLLRNFIKTKYLEKTDIGDIKFLPENYVDLEVVYCGANCQLIISEETISKEDIKNFKVKCLGFYIELCTQIRERFPFGDPVLKGLTILDPEVAMSGSIISLVLLMKRFPSIVTNLEKVDAEWRHLIDCDDLKNLTKNTFEDFWRIVFELKDGTDEYIFPNLTVFIKGIMSLPHSSATAERVFSQLCLIKSKTRNNLLVETCESLIHTKELLGDSTCYTFQPSAQLVSKNTSQERSNMLVEMESVSF